MDLKNENYAVLWYKHDLFDAPHLKLIELVDLIECQCSPQWSRSKGQNSPRLIVVRAVIVYFWSLFGPSLEEVATFLAEELSLRTLNH